MFVQLIIRQLKNWNDFIYSFIPELEDWNDSVYFFQLFAAPCYLAFGRHLNKPVIGIVTSAFHEWLSTLTGNPNNPSFMPGLFSSFGQRMTFWERLHNTFLTNLISWQMNYYLDEQGVYVKKFFNIDAGIPELYQDIAAILVNSHHSINGVRPMTTGVIEVGGLHINENSDPLTPVSKTWLLFLFMFSFYSDHKQKRLKAL